MIESTNDAEKNAESALATQLPEVRTPLESDDHGSANPADDDKTEAGNYFVANYPPFSFWKPELKPSVEEVLERPAPEDTKLGVYFHIPFCRKRCHFCYFLDRIGEGRVYDITTMSSNETIKQAVMAGLGIALISQHTVVDELHSGRLVALDLPGLPIERAWYLITRADVPLSPAAQRIRAHISGMKGAFLPQL